MDEKLSVKWAPEQIWLPIADSFYFKLPIFDKTLFFLFQIIWLLLGSFYPQFSIHHWRLLRISQFKVMQDWSQPMREDIICITHPLICWDMLKRPMIMHSKSTLIAQVYKASTISMLWFMDHPALISGMSRQNMAIFVAHMCGNMAAANQKLGRLLCQLNTTDDFLHLMRGIFHWIFLPLYMFTYIYNFFQVIKQWYALYVFLYSFWKCNFISLCSSL